jgi:LuxR family quorum-sensing transcriptional regulator LasR
VTLPSHGPCGEFGLLCLVSDTKSSKNFLQHTKNALPAISLLRDFIFESSAQFRRHPVAHIEYPIPELTPCELECLKWCADGKSSWEIANILHCAEATVNFHVSNIRRKLNVTTRRQAVVKAIRLGMIYPA